MNSAFRGNSAGGSGGAITNYAGVAYNDEGIITASITNTVFGGNSAGVDGGAIENNGGTGRLEMSLTNVTLSGNFAERRGGGIDNYGGSYNGVGGLLEIHISNSILFNNDAMAGRQMYSEFDGDEFFGGGEGGIQIEIGYTLVEGGADGSGIVTEGEDISVALGDGNIQGNPQFVTSVDPSNAPVTSGNLHLQAGSPAIDAGVNDAVPSGLTEDLDGEARIQNGVVDMGAYEK